ncbi:MAG: thiaminase II [Oscillospiraceae bacterium]|nr:thiaminase II [Oscillospiraceae bacterium]
MNTTEKMLAASAEIWQKYTKHPFVLGIQNGTLDREKFRYYIIQDYLYLEDYAKTFAVGVAKAKSLETANLFAKYIGVMNGELDVHKGYLARLGVTQQEIERTPRALDNLSYTSYMLRVAYEEGEAEILAAVLACACSYEFIAKNMVKSNPSATEDCFYGDWTRGYISPGYSEENAVLIKKMNRLSAHCTEKQIQHLVDIFVACSRYELAFWDMSWNLSR